MPKNIIVDMPGVILDGVEYEGEFPLIFKIRFSKKFEVCPHCGRGEKLRKKTRYERKVRHHNIGEKAVLLKIRGHKFYCRNCQRYFNQRFPGILPRRRYTESFRREIVNQHDKGIPQSILGKWRQLGAATIERWYHDLLDRKDREIRFQVCPEYLGIDEHSFTKKKGFVTTLCDLTNRRIMDVLPGRSEQSLRGSLAYLKEKERVKMVCMDLSDTYRSLVKQYFPQARIVADRFHVIRLINQHFLKTWHSLDPDAKYSRGLLSLMRRHEWHLKESQRDRFQAYLDHVPGLRPLYEFKQSLTQLCLMKHQNQRDCQRLVRQLIYCIEQLKSSGFESMRTLGNTLDSWKEEIACMWRYTKNNSITEGFHRKMKLIQRRAYGFKNFDNYRLRVRVLCGSINTSIC